ncbi:DNA-directed RNA polymerase I subunit rpa43-like isoform X2 [Phragmites australis]|uniref:DNA-directed RNA polymerase I subunit rpa43-like isoform X2 n=1 Tax=Phragmites australis TaxID=29695 RepID=UPI002D790722|nr:DNA-directed RNA polymerase I subunit rpa43-like isoform X2 [Phragmites australis]
MEALREAVAKLTVYVHPSNAADVRRAVARQLSALLFSYEDRFDGVLLAHEVSVEGEKAKILNGLVPYFGVPVHANLLLFSPQPDMILEGKVEMLGKESVHAIVLGVFSAAIMSDDIHEKFKFKRKGGGGKFVSRSDKQHVIKRGSMIRFSVKRVDTEMNCHITGSLIPPHTGSMLWLSVHDAEYASEINSGKKRSRDINIKIEQNEQEHRTLNNEYSMVDSERPHKSRKRNVEER